MTYPNTFRGIDNFQNISYEVSDYLKQVYFQLSITIMWWYAGFSSYPYIESAIPSNKFLQLFIIFCLIIPIIVYRYQEKFWKRTLLYCLGFSKGVFIGDFINTLETFNPGSIRLAMTVSIVIFSTLSLLSGKIHNRFGLYFSSIIFSCINFMVLFHLMQYFFDIFSINFIITFDTYFGIVLFSLYICYDTQKIIYDANRNLRDIEYHTLELFLDFINIFIRLFTMIIKSNKNKKK